MFEKTISEKIDFSKSEQYTLSIRLSTDGFSFSIYNPIAGDSFGYIRKEIRQTCSMAANLKEITAQSDFLLHPYKRVNILSVSRRFTLIPFDLFDDEQAETLFYYNFPKSANELILYTILKKTNAVVVFSIDKTVHQQLKELFPAARFYSQAATLIEHFAGKSRFGNSRKMYVYLRDNDMDVFCFERGKLLFANSLECSSTADRIYYLLHLWKQSDFDQERDEIHLTGMLEQKEELTAALKNYLKQVYIINPRAEFNNSELTRIDEVPFDMQTLLEW